MLGRREFIHGWSVLALATSLDAQVEIPSEFDTSLESIAVAFKGATGMTLGYLSQPKSKGPHPGVVLLHDVTGLSNGVRGAARNVATSGYAVVAPDFLSPQGGVASLRGVDADVRRAVAATTPAAVSPQASAALAFVQSHGGSGGRGLALVGFGWGATQAVLFAAGRTDLAACVAFSPDVKLVLPALAKTTAPVLAIVAGDDPDGASASERIGQLTVGGRRPHSAKVFAGTARGFHDPGETKAYKPDVARQAWTAAMAHLDAHAKKAPGSDA
jgi:carboxymethylenebutenolidase